MNDVVLNKIQTIQRCLKRIDEEFSSVDDFKTNYTKQDSVILNLERASQATIDIANHIIKLQNLGLPSKSRESFEILCKSGYISDKTKQSMQSMVGFRNIAVHDYQNLNIDIVISVVQNNLTDFNKYMDEIFENFLNG